MHKLFYMHSILLHLKGRVVHYFFPNGLLMCSLPAFLAPNQMRTRERRGGNSRERDNGKDYGRERYDRCVFHRFFISSL